MKHCPKCDCDKSESCFSKDKNRYDGLNGWCKECVSAAKKNWKDSNRQRIKEMDREWKRNNPEKVKVSKKKSDKIYYEKNKRERSEKNKAWRQKNQDREKARKQSPEFKAQKKRYREKLPDAYVIEKLTNHDVYTREQVMLNPGLVDVKRIKILVERTNILLKNKKQ